MSSFSFAVKLSTHSLQFFKTFLQNQVFTQGNRVSRLTIKMRIVWVKYFFKSHPDYKK